MPVSKVKMSTPYKPDDVLNTKENINKKDAEFDMPGLSEAVERKVRQWKERLIDLSMRNRLVNFKQTRSSTLKVVEPGISAIFDRLVKEEGEYYIYVQEEQGFLNIEQSQNSTQISAKSEVGARDPNELVCEGTRERTAGVLYTLRSRAQTEFEERGTNILFVALGFLRWTEIDASSVPLLSPVLLIPVQLERQRPRQRYRLTMAPEDVIINPAIALKLKNDFGITLPNLPENPEDLDLDVFLEEIKKVIAQRSGWQVSKECQIGLFSFLKFMMYKDLEANVETAKRHRIISALAGFPTLLPDVPTDLVTADTLDDAIKPERAFQILDADSSQQEAIVAALAGVSFVLQGPPGTGKSQTIANIIAECLAAGKRVLFISEKMAALDVVKRRLDQCGLGEFCLQLHSHKASKRAVLDQLSETLRPTATSQASGEQALFYQLEERRKQLNRFVKALHSPHGSLRLTPFQANSRLAHLWGSPDVPASIPKPLELTYEQLSEIVELLKHLAANGPIYLRYETHSWKGTLLTTYSVHEQTQIRRALDDLLEALTSALVLESHLTSLVKAVVSLLESRLLEKYNSDFMNLDLEDLLKRFTGQYSGSGKYLRYLGYRMSLRRMSRFCSTGTTSGNCAVGDLTLARLVRNGRLCFQTKADRLKTAGNLTSDTHFEMFAALVSWMEDCLSSAHELETCSIPVLLDPATFEDLRTTLESGTTIVSALKPGFAYLKTLFPLEQQRATERNLLSDVRGWAQLLCDGLPELKAWLDVEKTVKQLRSLGLAEFISESLKQRIKPTDLPNAFEKQFYSLWLDEASKEEPVLNLFNSTLHEQAIDEFRKLDKRLIQETPRRIINELRSRRPNTGFASPPTSGLGILQKEIQKRKRHKPLRRLFSEIPTLVQALKPCFLMSPLSVASYLDPGQMKFDILLFDEASQIMPEDAIGGILRSPQTIVVGDTKQLPPTRFFANAEGEELADEESEEEPILDSIMEEALASGLREKSLLWHYRSRDESLIAFSNHYFYNNTLITFPSAGTHDRSMGIEFLLVPGGVYDRSKSRTNRKEAEYVAQLVCQHYEQSPDRSLGVVAFSLSQADAIDAAVETLRQADSGFDEWCSRDSQERFFIKNLENVQGDERDVMFFSVGYGPDEKGQITMNFGPLNREEGRRRLNVAITRAREHVKLVSSFDPSQLDVSRIRAEGVRLLKEYMEVAKHGVDALPRAIIVGGGESESPFEEEVYEALRDKGLEVRKQIGVSGYRIDLGVLDPSHPGSFILGIECDGATYHSFKTARDRDRLRQQVLERLGWRIHRIWSRDWVEHRRIEIEKVIRVIEEAQNRFETGGKEPDYNPTELSPIAIAEDSERKTVDSPETNKPSENSEFESKQKLSMQDVSVYVRTPVANPRPSYMFETDTSVIADTLKRVVQMEGPIHKVEAAKRVAANWQIARVGYRIQDRIESIAQSNCPSVVVRGDFLWPKNMQAPPVRVPAPGDEARSIETIALEEIQQAALIVVKRNFGMTRVDLVRETARLLGHARTGDNVRSRIESAVDRLIQRTILHYNGELLNTA